MNQKYIGLILIAIALMGWSAFIIIPFTNLPYKAITMSVVLVVAEASFLVASFILGKEYVNKFRRLGVKKGTNERN